MIDWSCIAHRARRIVTGGLVACLLSAPCALAQSVSIGIPAFEPDIDLLTATHPIAVLVREAASQPLVERGAAGAIRPVIVDLLQVDKDFKRWSFRLRAGARFSNGAEIGVQDVLSSLRRCPILFPEVQRIEPRLLRLQGEVRERWVDIDADIQAEERNTFPLRFAECPIVESESAEVFGRELGKGVNFVGSGDFVAESFRRGREINLKRVRARAEEKGGAGGITLRAVSGSTQIISALRLGTLDAFVGTEAQLPEIPVGEATLIREQCGDFVVIKRRGFTLACDPKWRLNNLRYLFG